VAGFANTAAVKSAISSGKQFNTQFLKQISSGAVGLTNWRRSWDGSGFPGAGAEPATTPGTVYTSDSSSIAFADRASFSKYLMSLEATFASAGSDVTLAVMDRLVGVGGISLASTGTKTINSSALSRYTSGTGVELWLEVTTTTTGSVTLSVSSYTNDAGVSGLAGPSFVLAAVPASVVVQLPYGPGQSGIRSVEQLNVSVAASAGVVNVMLVKPVDLIGLSKSSSNNNVRTNAVEMDGIYQRAAFPRLFDGASLSFYFIGGPTSAIFDICGGMQVIYG